MRKNTTDYNEPQKVWIIKNTEAFLIYKKFVVKSMEREITLKKKCKPQRRYNSDLCMYPAQRVKILKAKLIRITGRDTPFHNFIRRF